jgi:nitrate reductase NapD
MLSEPDVGSVELHVSSLVVQARPERADEVAQAIALMPAAEVPGREGGKLVVTLVTPGERAILDTIDAITALPGVLSAQLVYHAINADEEASP